MYYGFVSERCSSESTELLTGDQKTSLCGQSSHSSLIIILNIEHLSRRSCNNEERQESTRLTFWSPFSGTISGQFGRRTRTPQSVIVMMETDDVFAVQSICAATCLPGDQKAINTGTHNSLISHLSRYSCGIVAQNNAHQNRLLKSDQYVMSVGGRIKGNAISFFPVSNRSCDKRCAHQQ